jgi:transcriptional regulator with XRE-family HTH domain
MNEISANIIDMEKEQLKAALKAIAKQHSISLSEVAKEAGVSPSTITGFLNDVPGRGQYGLSAKTQNKLSEKFPEFREFIEKPPALEQTVQVPVIGVWGADYRVTGLELGMSNNFISDWSVNIHLYSSVLRTETFFVKNFAEKMDHNLIRENRYYLFKNTYEEDINLILGKQSYASCEGGTYIGFLGKKGSNFVLYNFFGEQIKSAGNVKQASAIEWTRQI